MFLFFIDPELAFGVDISTAREGDAGKILADRRMDALLDEGRIASFPRRKELYESFQELFATWWTGGTLVLIRQEVRQDPAALAQVRETIALILAHLPAQKASEIMVGLPSAKVLAAGRLRRSALPTNVSPNSRFSNSSRSPPRRTSVAGRPRRADAEPRSIAEGERKRQSRRRSHCDRRTACGNRPEADDRPAGRPSRHPTGAATGAWLPPRRGP